MIFIDFWCCIQACCLFAQKKCLRFCINKTFFQAVERVVVDFAEQRECASAGERESFEKACFEGYC